MRLNERDYEILQTIYRYDGILSVDQFHRWFFGAKRRAYYRIQAFCEHGFLKRLPPKELYRVPEPILWLDKQGVLALANYQGVDFTELKWRAQPHFSRVSHDLALNEFRHTLELALQGHPHYELVVWHGQDELERLLPDPLEYLSASGEKTAKRIRPDGYFQLRVLADPPYTLRFFIELDNSTESNRRFGRDKVASNVHFLHSSMYEWVLGGKSGRFLVVKVGSTTQFHNLRAEVKQFGGAAYFLFTRSEDWSDPTQVLQTANLYLAHEDQPFTFESYHNETFQAYLHHSLERVPTVKLLPGY